MGTEPKDLSEPPDRSSGPPFRRTEISGNFGGISKAPLCCDHARDIGAIDVLHHDVKKSIRSLAEIEDGDDSRVAELGHRPGLVFEAFGESSRPRLLQGLPKES